MARSVAVTGVIALAVLLLHGPTPAAANPCAQNPCTAKPARTANDKGAEATFKAYRGWKKVNDKPVLSETHGNRWVFTYVNRKAETAGLAGKFPFAPGAVLAKESFENAGSKPRARGPLFIMEKRRKGYDAANNDWHYALVNPDGEVAMSGSGKDGSPTQFCAACHESAKVNDYVFGNGTTLKVTPIKLE
ncbi:MAG: cytochrome P460 family protein [Candidatus Rokubacteria bacterium]|nr:cytochrome P460 family protein [Candidatus Rokubacteria bacterium]